MPHVISRGQRINYRVHGAGPTVVLQHGLMSDAQSWRTMGYVGQLEADYRVVCVDSLGHGGSDKPRDPKLYGLRGRAGDVAAVLDAVGVERAHLVGYSMGGWIATGVAMYHPDRLLSLTLGGWDPVHGPPHSRRERALWRSSLQPLLDAVRARYPRLLDWATPNVDPAVRACWAALLDVEGAADALRALECPVLLWSGVEDPCYAGARECAAADGYQFFASVGDHGAALSEQVIPVCRRLRQFFEEAAARRGAAAL